MEPITEDEEANETAISGEVVVQTEVKQTWRQVKNTKLKWSPGAWVLPCAWAFLYVGIVPVLLPCAAGLIVDR